jgi:hypothetical protein
MMVCSSAPATVAKDEETYPADVSLGSINLSTWSPWEPSMSAVALIWYVPVVLTSATCRPSMCCTASAHTIHASGQLSALR